MTETASIYAYVQGFQQFETSYAAAMAFAILLIINLLVLVGLRRVEIVR
jgi:multiple sugar transport system permease protein